MKAAALLLTACLVSTPVFADAASDMAATANGFYAAYGKQKRVGGIPDAVARAAYAPYFSPRLAKQLSDAAATEAAYTKKFKAVPPLFEGDLFTSMFEGATSWKVGPCTGAGTAGKCPVQLTHADSRSPATWNDTLLLVNTPGGWKIDDVIYGAGFDFGNNGRLSETVRLVLAQAGQ